MAGLGGQLGQAGVAEQAQPVVEGHRDDSLLGPDRFVKGLVPAGTAEEGAAVNVDDHRGLFGVVGGPDIQILAVLAVAVVQPFPKLMVVEGGAAVLVFGGEGGILHGVGAEAGGIVDALPVGDLLGVFPAAGLGIADALEGGDAGGGSRYALDVAAGGGANMLLYHGKSLLFSPRPWRSAPGAWGWR